MVTADEEISLAYLLDPTFQLVNSAGKPLTDGWLEVYIHGTRNKYYCYSDWSGTLLPFKIPLDSLGSNIVLASPAHSYDVYVYNRFGSLVMSRYNVVPATGDGSVIKDVVTITSNDGTVDVSSSDQTNWDLSIKNTLDSVTELIGEELQGKKDKQSELVYGGNTHMTITRIKQNENGEITEVKYEPIDLPPEVPNVEITSPNGTIDVQSSTDVQTNTKTFSIDVNTQDPVWHYWTGNNAWTQVNTSSWTQINRPAIGAGSTPHAWNPDIKRGIYDVKAHFTVTFHNYENSKTVPNQIIQVGFRAKFVGKNDPTSINYVDLGSWTYDPSLYTTEAYQYNFAQESLRQNHDTSRIINVANYWGDTDFDVFFEAALFNTDGSQYVPSIDTVLFAEINYFGYHEVKGNVIGSTSGLDKVYHDSTLSGDGTEDSPLSVADPGTDIVIAREANGVIDESYDGVKIRQTDNGNEVVGLRKNDSWLSYGQLAPLSAGADKILITDSNGTLRWGVVGDGLELDDNDTLKTSDEVDDVVETVEKLEKDLDTKVISTFPIAQITDRTDFANMGQQAVGAKMLCQAFIIPINQTIRINSIDEEEPTLLGVYATQDYNGKIMLALYCYDFNEGSSDYVGDTGPINIRGGLNEYPLVHINPNYNVLSSDKVYYASLYLPSQHNSGLFLASCPAYSMQFNSMPRFTVGVYNITHDNQEIDMTDATTGRLDFNDGNGNYQIGPWSSGYNESNYNVPRLFMQIRNGHWEQPVIPTFPFEDIGNYTLILDNGVDGVFGNTSILNQSANYYPIWQTVSSDLPVDIVEFTIADGNPTHNPLGWNQGGFGIFTSNFGSRVGQGVTATITDTASEYYETYYHKYTLSSPIHLDAHVPYRFPAAYVTNLFSRVRQYGTPNNPKTLFMSDNLANVGSFSTFVRADNVQGTFLKVKDSNNNEYVI